MPHRAQLEGAVAEMERNAFKLCRITCRSHIAEIVQQALNEARYDAPSSIGDVLEIDRETRDRASATMKASCS